MLERYENKTDTLEIISPTGILEHDGRIRATGEALAFWRTTKAHYEAAVGKPKKAHSSDRFRKKAEEILGIPGTVLLEIYRMTEMNTASVPKGTTTICLTRGSSRCQSLTPASWQTGTLALFSTREHA